jgi:hypothetical protein
MASADNWENIINLMTGFKLADRGTITGKKGAGGTPWLDVTIKSIGMDLYTHGTPHSDGMGFDIEFYSGSGEGVRKYRATVTFTDQTDGRQYWKRSAAALNDLVNSPYKTLDSHTGTDVGGDPGADSAVDLTSFAVLAKSFDNAGTFFTNHAETLKQWAESLGEENAAWKGQAAGVFWHLINDLHDKYDKFKSDLIPPGFRPENTSVSTGYVSTTRFGDSIIGAEVALHKSLQDMNDHLTKFMNKNGSPVSVTHPDGSTTSEIVSGDTREVLAQVMAEIVNWVTEHNAKNVYSYSKYNPYGGYMGNPGAPITGYSTQAGYQDSTAWGNLKDTATWSGAANEAIKRWTTNVETNLDTPARADVTALQQAWSRVLNPNWDGSFTFSGGPSTPLSQDLQQEQAEIQQQQAADANKALNDALSNLNNNLGGLGDNINGLGNNLNGLGDNINNGLTNFGNGLGDNLNNGLTNFSNGLGNNLSTFSNGLDNSLNGPGGPNSVIPGGGNSLLDGGANGPGGLQNFLTPTGLFTTSPGGGNLLTNSDNPALAGARVSDGTITTQNGDGSLTSTFPDGSSTTVSPDGTVTTTHVDGTTSTSLLGPGQSITNPDGSTTSIGPNGQISTHFPDGSTVTQNGDGSLLTTNPDGSTSTHFPNGSTEVTDANGTTHFTAPDGSTVTQNSDGSVTTKFPDGSSTTVQHDGTVTTTGANGSTITSHLGNGQSITNPDGSTTTVGSNGQISTHFPDGSTVTQNGDGSLTTDFPNGSSTTHFPNGVVENTGTDGITHLTAPDGTTMTHNADGSLTSQFPGGSSTTLHPDGTVTSTTADGHTVTTHLGSGQSLVNPDGSTTTLGGDGSMTTHYPDGSTVTVHPDGTVTATDATGTGNNGLGSSGSRHLPAGTQNGSGTKLDTSTHLPTSGSDPHGLTLSGGNGSKITHFPSGATATTNAQGVTTTRFPDGSSTVAGPNGGFQTVPSPQTAAANLAAANSAGAATAGQPLGQAAAGASTADTALGSLMSPMMMMGMARMGGQQGGQGQGERIRDTYAQNDSDGAFIQGGSYQQNAMPPEEVFEEEEEDPEELPSRTPAAGQGRYGTHRPSTQSSWSDHVEDVWGTGEEGLPASLGR